MTKPAQVIVAITGASGAAYAVRLLSVLSQQQVHSIVVMSNAAQIVLETELEVANIFATDANINPKYIEIVDNQNWMHAIASGSSARTPMVVCPCSMGTLAAIVHGLSDNLIERAADVCLKENRPLILVARETPLSAIHLENMLKLSRMGATIMPAAPGFYQKPERVGDLVDFMVQRVVKLLGVEADLVGSWGSTIGDATYPHANKRLDQKAGTTL
jgi:flavin prenyltransferase